MSNRFRDPTMRREYDAAMRAFHMKHADLFLRDWTPRSHAARTIGSSFASFFWHGYNGTMIGRGFSDRESRSIIGYATYRAGQDAAKL